MKNKKISLVLSVGVLIFAFAFFASQVFGQSWTPPTQQFPQGNTSAPLDVSTDPQTKPANLGANSVISNVTGVAPAFVMPQGSFIGTEVGGGGSNKIFLTAGSNMVFTAAGGFLVNAPGGPASFAYSKGLTLPNYSTAVLGTGVQEGTLTYNNGKLYIFVPGGGQGQQQETRNNLLNNANAQTFNGRWAEVGGGTVINNYSSSSAPSVWLSGRGGVYTTSTKASIGQTNGTNLEMVVSANGVVLQVVTPGGINKGPINSANAQSVATAFSISNAGAVSVTNPFTANTLTANGAITAKNSVAIAPGGNTAPYTIKNSGGTFGLYAGNNPGANLTLGQDGALGVKGKIIYQGDKLSIIGNYSSGAAVYETNWQESPPNQTPPIQCPCDTTSDWMDCQPGGTAPANLVGQSCYDRIERESGGLIPGRKLILTVSGTSGRALLQLGGMMGSNFKAGALRLAQSENQGVVLTSESSGRQLRIGADGTNDSVRINLDSLFTNGQSNCTNSGIKFLRIDADGDLTCDTLPASSGVEYVEMPGNRSDPGGFYGNRNGLNGTCGQASCEGTYDVASLSEYKGCFQSGWISRGANTSACFIFKDNNAGKWKVRIFEWWDGAAFCKISCIK